jgi:two-component system heavy metal sensor histidine kinase CusS
MSIALKMAIWYGLSAFALVLAATGTLYWVLATNLYQEDVSNLSDNLDNARLLWRLSSPGQLPQSPISPAFLDHRGQPEIYLRVLDRDARTLVETPGLSDEIAPPETAELVDGGRRTAISRSGKSFLTLMIRAPGENPADPAYFIQGALDLDHDDYILSRYRARLGVVLGLSLILSALAGYLIARSGMRPIANISRTAARIGSATLHERIATLGLPAELSGLAQTFNDMLDRLEGSFARISQFSDDVAHELRTPVNNLRGEIEVALSKARSGEEYREILGSCLEECARISRLIQSLLFLARTESAAEMLQRETVDVGKELATVQEFYEAAASDAGIRLRTSTVNELCMSADRTLLQQAIGNLVSNAIAHTPPGGAVEIGAGAEGAWLTVKVADTGCGIAAEHLPHVFERFYRADPARSNSANNVGLGLAVVKSIVTRHRGHVEIDSEIDRGTEVRLVFPMVD